MLTETVRDVALRIALAGASLSTSEGTRLLNEGGFLQAQFRTALAVGVFWGVLIVTDAIFVAFVVLLAAPLGHNVGNSVVYILFSPALFALAGVVINGLRVMATDTMRRFSRWQLAWSSAEYDPTDPMLGLLVPRDRDLVVQLIAAILATVALILLRGS